MAETPSLRAAPQVKPEKELQNRQEYAKSLLKRIREAESPDEARSAYTELGTQRYPGADKDQEEAFGSFKDKYGYGPEAPVKQELKDGQWQEGETQNVASAAGAGFLRPFERMLTPSDQPSAMEYYQVPSENYPAGRRISNFAGEAAGYATQFAPYQAATKGLANKALGTAAEQVAEKAAGQGIKEVVKKVGTKAFLRDTAENMVAGTVQEGINSGGDPEQMAYAAGVSAVVPYALPFAAYPLKKFGGKVAEKLAGTLKNNAEVLEKLPDEELAKMASNPEAVASEVADIANDTAQKSFTLLGPAEKEGAKAVPPGTGMTGGGKPTEPAQTGLVVRAPDEILDPGAKMPSAVLNPEGTKQSKYAKTISESPRTKPELAKDIDAQQVFYKTVTNKGTVDNANAILEKEGLENAIDIATDRTTPLTPDKVALGQILIDRLQREGRYADAVRLVENQSVELSKHGQTIQAAAIYNRMTPTGMLKFLQNTYRNASAQNPGKPPIEMTPQLAGWITEQMEQASKMPDGKAKAEAIRNVMQKAVDRIPTNLFQKLETAQTIAQLLNPKTVARNVIGNTIFSALENANQVLATGLDTALSKVTGKRTTTLPNVVTQARGFVQGLRQGIDDVRMGVDTGSNKFDVAGAVKMPVRPKTWNNDTWLGRMGNWFEKTMGYTLRPFDKAASQAAFEDAFRAQQKLAQINKVPFDPIAASKKAEEIGLYRTFQDDTRIASAFSKIKKALNLDRDFGLGSFVLKYPKTPANILARGMDYSPLSFLKAMNTLGNAARGKGFNQEAFVNHLSKATTGTGLIGMGWYLRDLGILTGRPAKDPGTRGLQQEEGLGNYKINMSALKRFMNSGFDPNTAQLQEGDELASYDWAQPTSIALAVGANARDYDNKLTTDRLTQMAESALSGADTLYEMPLFTGVRGVLGNESLAGVGKRIAEQVGSSFTPTIVSQVGQYMDPAKRYSYDPALGQRVVNLVKAKVPGLREQLPQQIGLFGRPLKQYESGNSFFNVFLNPAFVSKYQPTPETKFAIDLFFNTGEGKHIPVNFPQERRSVYAYGYEINPDGKTLNAMQKYAGERYLETYQSLLKNPDFKKLDPQDQASMIQKAVSKIGTDTKLKFLGDQFLNHMAEVGDQTSFDKMKYSLLELNETEKTRNIYDAMQVMSKEERGRVFAKIAEQNPDMASQLEKISAEKKYNYIMSLSPDQRSQVVGEIPDNVWSKIVSIRKKYMRDFGMNQLPGGSARQQAEFAFQNAMQLGPEERKAYLIKLLDSDFLSSRAKDWIQALWKNRDKKTQYYSPPPTLQEFQKKGQGYAQ